jgi:hypothetical protein
VQRIVSSTNEESFDFRLLLRLASWGGAAAVALALAVVAAETPIGTERLAGAPPMSSRGEVAALSVDQEKEKRQMLDIMRSLSADRDRLLARVTVLERNLEDMTGSVAAARPPTRPEPVAEKNVPPPAPPAAEAPSAIAPNGFAAGPSFAATVAATPLTWQAALQNSPPPLQPQASMPEVKVMPAASGSKATQTEFGVDLGGAGNLESLRGLWAKTRAAHGGLLEGLHPVVAVHDAHRPGGVSLRLVAGPLANAAAAAQLCARLAAGGVACRPAVFDGQRLALR